MTDFRENNIQIFHRIYIILFYTKKKKISIAIDYLKSAMKNIIIEIHNS